MRSEPNTWLVQDFPICTFYFQTLSCSLLALLASTTDWLLNFLISESPAIGCVQHSFLHFTLPNTYVAKAQQHCPLRPRNIVLTSMCNAWISDTRVPERAWPEIDIPKCDHIVTFLSVTDTYIHMHISLIEYIPHLEPCANALGSKYQIPSANICSDTGMMLD